MSQPAVNWGQLKRYCEDNGFEFYHDGGDTFLIKDGIKHRIGHTYCNKHKSEIPRGHMSTLKRKFGITRKDILGK